MKKTLVFALIFWTSVGHHAHGFIDADDTTFRPGTRIRKDAKQIASSDTLKSVVRSAVTGGLVKGIGHHLGLTSDPEKFLDHAQHQGVVAAVDMGIGLASGEKGGDLLERGARTYVAGVMGGTLASQIGKAYGFSEINPVSHKLLHGLLGGATGAIMADDPEQGMMAGALGAFIAETYADLFSPEKPMNSMETKIKAAEEAKGSSLTEKEFLNLYEAELKDYGVRVGRTADFAKIVSATTVMMAGVDVPTSIVTAKTAVDHNFLHLVWAGIAVGSLAYSGYQVHKAYETEGIKGALQELGIHVGTYIVGGIAIKGAVKIGSKVYPSLKEGLKAVFDSNPGLAKVLGGLTQKLKDYAEKMPQQLKQFRQSDVWREGPVVRGEIIEGKLGHNLPKTFPIIDKFKDGVATSIKSIDLSAETYQNVGKLQSVLRRCVDKVAGFRGAKLAGEEVLDRAIKGRALDIAIPNLGTKAQQTVIEGIKDYAISKGITVNIVVI